MVELTAAQIAARELAAARKQENRTCEACGVVFRGLVNQVVCSDKCRWRRTKRLYRARRSGTQAHAPPEEP